MTKPLIKLGMLCFSIFLLAGCDKDPVIESRMLDGQVAVYDVANQTYYSGEWDFVALNSDNINYVLESSTFKNGLRNGTTKIYFENGRLFQKGSFKNNLKEGAWESYYPSGELQEELNFKNGIVTGLYKAYYLNGALQQEGTFKDGLGDGLWVIYYDNGQVSYKGELRKGKKEGTWLIYDVNGQLVHEQHFVDGVDIESSNP